MLEMLSHLKMENNKTAAKIGYNFPGFVSVQLNTWSRDRLK